MYMRIGVRRDALRECSVVVMTMGGRRRINGGGASEGAAAVMAGEAGAVAGEDQSPLELGTGSRVTAAPLRGSWRLGSQQRCGQQTPRDAAEGKGGSILSYPVYPVHHILLGVDITAHPHVCCPCRPSNHGSKVALLLCPSCLLPCDFLSFSFSLLLSHSSYLPSHHTRLCPHQALPGVAFSHQSGIRVALVLGTSPNPPGTHISTHMWLRTQATATETEGFLVSGWATAPHQHS